MKRLKATTFFVVSLVLLSMALAQVKLDFWSWRVEDVDAYREIIAGYMVENPGVEINFQAFEVSTYNTVLTTALTAGEGPDIIHVRAYGNLETFAAPGYLKPLDGVIAALDDFPPLSLDGERLRSDGRVYAVPFASQTLVIHYNTDIFEELGLSEPTTWDEFIATAEALQAAGYIPLANGTATAWMNEVLMGVFGPNVFGADFFNDVVAGETTFEDPRYLAALERLLELRPYLAPQYQGVDYPTAQNLFVNGLAGMFAGGSWEIANFRNLNPELNASIMAPPASAAGESQLVSWFLDGGYAANADTAHPEEALKFLEFLASQEFGQQLTDKLANLSPIPGVVPSDPLLAKLIEMNANSTPYVFLVGFRYQEPTGSVLFQERSSALFAGTLNPEQLAQELTAGIATYYTPFQTR